MLQQQSTAAPSGERYANHDVQYSNMFDKHGAVAAVAAPSASTGAVLLQEADNSSSERVTNRRPNTLLLANESHTPHVIVDQLAESAKSADLKALIRYVGSNVDFKSQYVAINHMYTLQQSVRDVTHQITYFINAVDAVDGDVMTPRVNLMTSLIHENELDATERRRSRRRQQVRVIAAAGLRRRLLSHCRVVSDEVLPSLVEALRVSMIQPERPAAAEDLDEYVRAQLILVEEVIASLQPCVQMVLIARRLLDEIDDVDLVTSLTSLVLAVAEALSRMRIAAGRSLTELAFTADDEKHISDASPYDNSRLDLGSREATGSADLDDDDKALNMYDQIGASVGMPLVSMEICDAAYRQIQHAGSSLECCYWPPIQDMDHLSSLLASIITSCYEIGSSMEVISKSAERHDIPSFNDSVRQFADAVCRVMVAAAQIGLTKRRLAVGARAIRHCACSLVTSARLLACDGQYSGSHSAFSAHSHALSRALADLVNCLSTTYIKST